MPFWDPKPRIKLRLRTPLGQRQLDWGDWTPLPESNQSMWKRCKMIKTDNLGGFPKSLCFSSSERASTFQTLVSDACWVSGSPAPNFLKTHFRANLLCWVRFLERHVHRSAQYLAPCILHFLRFNTSIICTHWLSYSEKDVVYTNKLIWYEWNIQGRFSVSPEKLLRSRRRFFFFIAIHTKSCAWV
jgi:hypothetical protein